MHLGRQLPFRDKDRSTANVILFNIKLMQEQSLERNEFCAKGIIIMNLTGFKYR